MPQIFYEGIYHDHVDAFIAGEVPVVPAPRRDDLTTPESGYRYVVGADGLSVQAATPLMRVAAPLQTWSADSGPRLGPVPIGIAFPCGKPPMGLLREAQHQAAQVAPNEWAALIGHDGEHWRLIVPEPERQGPSHIRYSRDAIGDIDLYLDLHTHGDGPAFFSGTDNADDIDGVHFAAVIGHARAREPSVALRLVIHGHHFDATYSLASLFDPT